MEGVDRLSQHAAWNTLNTGENENLSILIDRVTTQSFSQAVKSIMCLFQHGKQNTWFYWLADMHHQSLEHSVSGSIHSCENFEGTCLTLTLAKWHRYELIIVFDKLLSPLVLLLNLLRFKTRRRFSVSGPYYKHLMYIRKYYFCLNQCGFIWALN